jgi:Xaa-Pro aminopeptidase
MDGRLPREEHFRWLLSQRLPGFEVRDLTPILDELRLIKTPREIELIRQSTRLHGEAILEAMRSTAIGVTEYELESVAKFIFHRHGAQGEGYQPLMHSGTNSYFNHLHAGRRPIEDGDMLLFDYAPDVGYYVSDMGRMWPANGRFNATQRELYGFYLGFYEAILHSIRPGLTPQQVKQEALTKIDPLLASTRFSKPIYEQAARQFVEGYREAARSPTIRLGHWVGMAVHDVGSDTGPLRAGMVLVIEPQFRVPEERLYIRLEDMILITGSGVEIMSDFVPRDIERIEQVMHEPGLLQSYPRLFAPARSSRSVALP